MRVEKGMKDFVVDEQVLEIISTAIIQDVPDANNQPSKFRSYLGSYLSKQFKTLLELLTSRHSSYKLFVICSSFYHSMKDYRMWLEYCGKAYRILLNNPTLQESPVIFKALVDATLVLANAYIECVILKQEPRVGGEEIIVCGDGAYQARMVFKAVIGRTKAHVDSAEYDRLKDAFAELKK